jgi:hypothetical protein
MTDGRRDAIGSHGEECAECRADTAAVAAVLERSAPPVDAAQLSALVLARAHAELAARAGAVFWRRLAVVLAVALIPLPVIVAADLWALGWLYALASAWLPAVVATYLVVSYGATVMVLLGSVYAAIPLLLARPLHAPEAATA